MGDDKEQTIDEALAEDPAGLDKALAEAAEESAGQRDNSSDEPDLESQLKEAEDRVLRVQADLENYRKRARRELDEGLKYAATPLIRDLLPVIDNMQRAMSAEQTAGSETGLLEGVQMVADQLAATLAQHGCQAIKAEGEPFDPMRHEALLQQHSDEYPAGTVIQVAQTGYQLHDRVVRPAHVIVSQGPAEG